MLLSFFVFLFCLFFPLKAESGQCTEKQMDRSAPHLHKDISPRLETIRSVIEIILHDTIEAETIRS